MTSTVFILNGPTLNLLGTREVEIYGSTTLKDIEAMCAKSAGKLGLSVDFRQSNHEGELVDWIQEAGNSGAAAIILNGAAYTHTSVAIHDALRSFDGPIVEVHLSNVFKREKFRHHSFVSEVADGVICGLGPRGYTLALEAVADKLKNNT
jgi:3-dehydroquinate dehydratase-2